MRWGGRGGGGEEEEGEEERRRRRPWGEDIRVRVSVQKYYELNSR